jgi:endopeptidase La
MTDIVKKLKLNLLQKLYKDYSLIISNLGHHIDNLNNNYLIDYSFKQTIMNKLNDLNRNINTSYNNYIVENLDNNSEFDKNITDLIKNIKSIDENVLMKEVQFFIKHMNQDILPFNKYRVELIHIISLVGYTNLIDILEFLIGDNFLNKLEPNTIKKIQEYNSIFIPISFDYFQVNKDEEIYWRKPIKQSNKNETDLLDLIRELWIKNPCATNKNYFKINGFFKNDTIGVIFKTSQINYPCLYDIKNDIEKAIENSSIDTKFAKKFTRHDYLGNLYCLTASEYIKYLEKMYQKFMELSTSTFLTVMKEFIAQGTHLKVMYDIILLLLLGTVDNIDIAGLLLGLTKEKKSSSPNIHNLIINRLPFSLQIKLKKSNNTIKQELERLKNITSEDIDYKKQIISNKNIPDNVKNLTLEKIQEMKLYNNEYYKQLTFVKHIINYPWTSSSDDLFYESLKSDPKKALDYLKNIENQLMKSSYGHEEAKKSLLQIIGKWISNPSSQGTSFGLVGPPGVGKTLLAKSVSKALNIPFAQITLGGQNDGELLHGHGYTYSGSQPGLIIKKMVEAGKSRCILYFDELDKATSKHGHINEITSILIHLTDPNMNKTFQDRFFQGVEFPLDKVIFIFSYNDSSLVDPILLDRLKEINVKPYTSNEKIKIVKDFVIPEMKDSIGLHNDKWIHLKDDIIEYIIDNYTNEAGVRDIKRYIEKMFLTLNLDKIYNKGVLDEINIDVVNKLLDKPVQEQNKIHPKPLTGIINGLYATNNGDGGIIPIQIFNNFSSSPNSFEIKLTGKQGDVMKESVHCSLTAAIDYIRRNTNKYKHIKNLDEYLIKNFKYGFHVHAPSTSTPKDGPSAGCAFTSAFISRILNKPIKNDIAMTGEIELTGRITKIGGLNFKLIGAKKAGVKLVFVPLENKKDLEEIKEKYPKLLDENFQAKYFEFIDDIIDDILLVS